MDTETILKPISDVVKYVTNVEYWHTWGIELRKAENVNTNLIHATYSIPYKDAEWNWSISIDESLESQVVTFTDITHREQPVEYTFTSTGNGANTVVVRKGKVNNPLLLEKLKAALDGRTIGTIGIENRVGSQGPP